MNVSALCDDDQRRDAVRNKPGMNGLDYLDVGPDQLTLTVFFLGKAPRQLRRGEGESPAAYKQRLRSTVKIEGGRRVRNIAVEDVQLLLARDSRTGNIDPLTDDRMIVRVNKYGDFSTYTLRLVGLDQIDPFYDHLDFSFKIDCPSDFDCAPEDTCPPSVQAQPEINYLAKDYASFRQLILDRLALIMPDWKERHVPDIGITLVELLAYVGDHLSYYQDAVATEAYLDTARQRISVRRHARLVDYQMHEGCNARAWVCINTDTDLVDDQQALQPGEYYFITSLNNALAQAGSAQTADALGNITADQYEVFEPVASSPLRLYVAHNEICLYTWGQRECCLPRGATSATLKEKCAPTPVPSAPPAAVRRASKKGGYPTQEPPPEPPEQPERELHLQAGDVLIFEEVIGPRTGSQADADPTRRHAVRLTRVTQAEDVLYDPPIQVVEIEWAAEDALPFTLCISAITDAAHGCTYVENVSVARGNVVLVDHGRTLDPQDLGMVPCASTQAECDCAGHPGDTSFTAGRYRPKLDRAPLTWRQALPADNLPNNQFVAASRLLLQDVRAAAPQVQLSSIPAAAAASCEQLGPLYSLADTRDPARLAASLGDTTSPIVRQLRTRFSKAMLDTLKQSSDQSTPEDAEKYKATLEAALEQELKNLLQAWSAQPDLLSSRPDDWHFVVEVDNDGIGHIRFGDGTLGQQPEAGSAFFATYRIGSGVRGNVGAEAISQIVFRDQSRSGVYLQARNPLPAQGGAAPEPIAEVKLYAPFAFRKQLQRAITADDYAQLALRNFEQTIQRAAATMSWTGSWYEARVAIDSLGSEEASPDLRKGVERQLDNLRRIGHDLSVTSAQYVPIDVELSICVLPHYLRGHVEAALLNVFSNRMLPNGKRGFFHPDNLMFGNGIYLSQLVAAAQAVTGVESVTVTKLQRRCDGDQGEIRNGVLPLGPLEVAQLNNDPNFPEHGKLVLNMRGGR